MKHLNKRSALSEQGSVAARAIAATAVDGVLTHGRNLDDALLAAGIESADITNRSMVRALAFGTLRTQLRNQRLIDLLVKRPFRRRDSIVVALISTGLYALADARRPDYAVVSSTVDAVASLGYPRMRGVVNAVLRRYLREQDQLLAAAQQHADARWLHPDWLIAKIKSDWPDHWETILTGGSRQAPMWLRVNAQRISRDAWLAKLGASGVAGVAAHPVLEHAVMLDHPLGVEQLPGFSSGEVSVQDAASQLAAPLLTVAPGMRVLDACAAPGGKAAHILESCPAIGELVAVDQSVTRLARLRENMLRLGLKATVIEGDAAAPAAWWDGVAFDRILLDAPCSATGVLRRHPDIAFLRRTADLPVLRTQQLQILQQLWPLLKPGGQMLYATCSVLRDENDAIIAAMLSRTKDAELIKPALSASSESVLSGDYGLQLLPGVTAGDTDGFYYALMARRFIA